MFIQVKGSLDNSLVFQTDTANIFLMKNVYIGLRRVTFYPSSEPTNEASAYRSQPLDKEGVKPMDKRVFKKDGLELQEYLMFRRRGSRVNPKKGKGSKFNRSAEKNKARKQTDE